MLGFTQRALVVGVTALSIIAAASIAASGSLRLTQIILGIALVIAAFAADRRTSDIPIVMRPGPLVMASALVGSLSIGLLTDEDYNGAYFGMWLFEIFGFLAAMVVWGDIASVKRPAKTRTYDTRRLVSIALWIWWIGAACALAFFKMKGIPFLSASVEQGRVDAASSGTGYIRVLAFMTGPATIVLFAGGHRRRWLYLVATVVLTVLFGNRTPVIYVVAPLVAMAAIVGNRIKSRHLIAVAAVGLVAVGAFGAYRVMSGPEFRSYAEYRDDLAQGNSLGIAETVVTHYSEVVPANAVLVKHLVDSGAIPQEWGSTYLTLFLTALPGEQLSPDLLIKRASGASFVGGGTPPTLMGEGYMNFGYLGVFLGAFLTMGLARHWAIVANRARGTTDKRLSAAIYGYVITWAVFAQVAGLAGAATIPLAGFLVLVGIRALSTVRQRSVAVTLKEEVGSV